MKCQTIKCAVTALTIITTGCASTADIRETITGRPQANPIAQGIYYDAASDLNVRISTERVVLAGSPEFIPQDPNWIQIHLRIENRSKENIHWRDAKLRLVDGQVIKSAQSVEEILKKPDYLKNAVMTVGVGTAGMVVGTFLFPPAALAAGAAIVFAPLAAAGRMQKAMSQAQKIALRPADISPETNVRGAVWVPAVTGQSGLMTFYEIDGRVVTLQVPVKLQPNL